METKLTTDLEKMVDVAGLDSVLRELAKVCYLKAEHIQANYADPRTAHHWEALAARLERAEAAAIRSGLT